MTLVGNDIHPLPPPPPKPTVALLFITTEVRCLYTCLVQLKLFFIRCLYTLINIDILISYIVNHKISHQHKDSCMKRSITECWLRVWEVPVQAPVT